jgi:hypothetical protein
MKKFLFILSSLALLLTACGEKQQLTQQEREEFATYISAYTSDVISTGGEIVVRLTSGMQSQHREGDRLFELTPSVRGSEVWLDERTVAFRPAQRLRSGTRYRVAFHLEKLAELKENPGPFLFEFETLRQDMEVEFAGLTTPDASDRSRQTLSGRVHTADTVDPDEIQKVLTARQDGSSLGIEWEEAGSGRIYEFTVTGIQRKGSRGSVQLSWNGTPVGAGARGSTEIPVSGIDEFELVQTRVIRSGVPFVELTFSDPVDRTQNLRGLIHINSVNNLNFIVQENRVEVYPGSNVTGERTLTISEGVRNRDGQRLGQEITRTVLLHQPAPEVRLVGRGVIIPKSDELLLPFEAVSLGAVDVQVTRIFANNITQFLQDNSLSGGSRLGHVGRPVVQEVVPLSRLGVVDAGSWNGYALDLSTLIDPEPGAIYRVDIGFRKHQIVYPCSDAALASVEGREWTAREEEEESYWNRFGNFYYPPNYNWRDRDDPCTDSYYTRDRAAGRNVLASDLGLIAKQGEVGAMQVFVTDLKTTAPAAGVNLEFYDYQQQLLGSFTSDSRGEAEISLERKPWLMVAKKDEQRGYLRLDDGSSLSLSDFDVSGVNVNEGIKGFMYGERGVWRPGDSLYVSLIVEDKNNILPDDHPVTFELRDPSGRTADRRTVTNPVRGFYTFRTKTSRDAQPGRCMATARLGGNTFSTSLNIETVRPNRLKVNLSPDQERVTSADRTL